jgi:hypothetical protein
MTWKNTDGQENTGILNDLSEKLSKAEERKNL